MGKDEIRQDRFVLFEDRFVLFLNYCEIDRLTVYKFEINAIMNVMTLISFCQYAGENAFKKKTGESEFRSRKRGEDVF